MDMDAVYKAELLYVIPPEKHNKEELIASLTLHPEIKFVSLVGIDLEGNDTDEKIPIKYFLKDIDKFLSGGVQTDGSSVVLPGIATLNDSKVDLVADPSVNWFIDYNYEHIDADTGKPVGTLRIPSFLIHNGKRVDSRSVLRKATEHVKKTVLELLEIYPSTAEEIGVKVEDIKDVILTVATELEFWVKTPNDKADVEELSASQVLQEQYWKRTKGCVRTAMEKALLLMDKYGMAPEMGHKEVGGVKARIGEDGKLDHIMEQLEIDWKYAEALQAADNELFARILIKETFRRHGLEVTFMAKPIEGVAGSGEHTHVGIALKLKDGTIKNLFTPKDMKKEYLSSIGWGALMGILKNYEVVNPFIASSNDALNRLKPGFEAPVCIVASVGHNVCTPSRNRTVLIGLVRDIDNPLATRFEVRSPNPFTNTYLAVAAIYQVALDGIKAVVKSGKKSFELEKEFSKKAGEEGFYLEKNRAYRSEEDIFEYYSEEERNKLFGIPPATVWENLKNIEKYPCKAAVLKEGDVFDDVIINSYILAVRNRWTTELKERIIPENLEFVRRCCIKLHGDNSSDLDDDLWNQINSIRKALVQDTLSSKGLFSRIREAIDSRDYDTVSRLQLEMASEISRLKSLYVAYKRNLLDCDFLNGDFETGFKAVGFWG